MKISVLILVGASLVPVAATAAEVTAYTEAYAFNQSENCLAPSVRSTRRSLTDSAIQSSSAFADVSTSTGNSCSASVSAYADLNMGAIGTSSLSNRGGQTLSVAGWADTAVLFIPTAAPTDRTAITVDLRFNGMVNARSSNAFARSVYSLNFGQRGDMATSTVFTIQTSPTGVSTTAFSDGWGDFAYRLGRNSITATGTYYVTGPRPLLDFGMTLTSHTTGDVTTDFSNAAQFNWRLPIGVNFQSESGSFLSSVPEPGALAALGLGVGLLGLAVRRRRSA